MARLTFDEFQRRSKEITQEQQKSGTWYNDALTAIATTPVRTSKVSSFDDFLAQSNAISARNQAMDLLLGSAKDEDEDEKEPKNTKNSRVNLEPLATDQSAAGPMAGGIEEPRNARVNFQRLSSTYDQLVPDNDLAQPVRGIHYYNQLDTRPDAQKAPQELQQQDLWKQAANQIGGELRTAYSGVLSPAQRATEGERQKRLQGYSLIPSLPDYAENSRYRDNRDGEVRYNALSGMFTGGYADPQYAAINRQSEARGMREANAATTGAGFVGESQSELDMMTDQEIGIYNYLYATRGKEEADQYIEDIRRDLTARQNEKRNTRYAEWAQEQPVAASAFSVVEGPYKALSFVGQLADYAEGESTPYGYGGNVDTNAGYNKFAQTSGAVRGAVGQQIQDKVSARYGDAAGVVANKGYQLFMSYLDSRYNALISGAVPFRGEMLINPKMAEGLSLGIMGAGAAADSMIEAKKRGLDDGQAFMLGLIGGAAEIVTEQYSLESLLDADLAKESAVRYLVKTMAAEGSEEMASDLINEVADLWVSGDQAEMRQEIAGYMAKGMTRGQATGKAIGRFALQVLESGLGGALMGGLGGGMMIGTNALGTRSAGRDIRNMGTETVQSVIEEGLQSPEGSYSRELAERAQEKQAAGKKLSAAEIGRLQQVNELQIAEEARAEDESLDQRAQDTLLDLARDKVAEETGVDMTQAVEEAPAESRQNEARAAETAQKETVRAEEETSRSEARSEAAEAENETEFVELGGEEETTSIPMQSRSLMTMRTRLAEAYEAQKKQAFDPAELEKVKSAFGTAGQKALTDNYKGEQMTARYVRGFMAFYNAGLTGTRASDVSLGARALISTDTAVRAWAAGRQDAQAKNAQLTAQKGNVAVVQNPGIDYSDAKTSEWAAKNGETVRRVNQLTQALGMSMTVEDIIRVGKTGEANAQLLNARLTLSNNAEKRTATYRGENISNPVMWTIGHEVGHRLRELAPEAFDALAKTMPQEAVRDIEWQQYAYAKAGVDEKFESAAEEAAANYVADLLEGGQVLDEFIDRQTRAGNRRLLQKLGDVIRNVYRDVKAYLSGDEARAIRQSIKKLEAALDAAAKQAAENAKNGKFAENETQKAASAADIQKSNYSIKSSFEAIGMDARLEGGRVVVYDQNGNRVEHVTEQHVRGSVLGAMIDYALNETGTITEAEAKKQIKGMTDLLNIMIKAQDGELVWKFSGAAMFSAVKSNSDGQYGTTVDFSTVCRKTQEMMDAMSEAMIRLGRGLTKAEVIELQADILSEGGTVPCPVCYVFSRWAGVGGILDNMAKWQERYKGIEWDDPAKVQDRINEIKAATRTKADLRRTLMEQDQRYIDLAAQKEDADRKRTELRNKSKRATLTEEERTQIDKEIRALKAMSDGLNKQMKEIENSGAPEAAWLERVRIKPDYREHGDVPLNVLYNLSDAEKMAGNYPLAWGYRTTRGPSAGKAILPYADMRVGDMVMGPGKNRVKGNAFETLSATLTDDQRSEIEKALMRVKAQNLIGGQRYQSTSDFRYDYGLDYLLSFFEGQMLGTKMQTYTKIIEFVDMVNAVRGDVNISMMPYEAGYVEENGVDKLVYSSVTGVNEEAAIRANSLYDNAQLILVGINDRHIRAALEDSEETGGIHIGFVIPYHASGASINEFIRGLVENLSESFNEEYYRDYSKIQTDSVSRRSGAAEKRLREIRDSLLRGKHKVTTTDPVTGKTTTGQRDWRPTEQDLALIRGKSKDISGMSFDALRDIERRALAGDKAAIREYKSWSAGVLWDIYNKMWVDESAEETYGVRLNTAQAASIMPHEYWNKSVSRDKAYVNGFIFRSYCYNLGLTPRFTGVDSSGRDIGYGDFSDSRGYWKTLIDRPMYDNSGRYRDQQRINVTRLSDTISESDAGMLSPEYGETAWEGFKVREPEKAVSERAANKFVARKRAEGAKLSLKQRDDAYAAAVERGDMDEAQRMVDEAASQYIERLLLPNDDDEKGFKYHRGPAPTKTFKRYAVLNVSPDGFRAAYAGNKNPTPMGVWLDAQNLQSYMSDMVQFDDGSFASYIPGDTGAATKTKFSPERQEEYGLRGGQRWLLERGGKHSSDVPNFSQMNLKQNENGEKVVNALRDGALPHNKLIFEIEYGISDEGDLTDYVKEHGRMMKGKNQGLSKIGPNQYYDFKTNPNAVGKWGIGGTFRIVRLVPYSEVVSVTNQYKENAIAEANRLYEEGEISRKDRDAQIKNANAIQVQKWVNGYHPEDFGLTEESVQEMVDRGMQSKLTDPVTYDDDGNVIPLSERFNSEKQDIRYSLKGSDVQKEYMKPFAEQLRDYMDKEHRQEIFGRDSLLIGSTPKLLQDIGLPRLPVVINQKHVGYAIDDSYDGPEKYKAGHTFEIEEFAKLPEKLADPIAIIADPSKHDLVIYVEMTNKAGAQTIVPFRVDTGGIIGGNNIHVQRAKSVFGDEDAERQIVSAIVKDNAEHIRVYYVNEKKIPSGIKQAVRKHGLQVPRGIIHSIHEEGSPVKPDIKSQTGSMQFKRWFGDWAKNPRSASKIVNEDGTPKIVYHQTAGDFTVFSNGNPVAGATDSETPNGYFFKDNDHDIGLGGNHQMAVYLNMRKPLHFRNREEANRWYQRHVDGYAELQNEMQRKLDPIDAEMNRLENEMFGDDVTDEKYDELNARWDELHDEMKAVEDDYRGRLRELLNEHFLENDSGYDGIILDYDGHRYVNGKRENVKSYIVFKNTQIKSATDNVGTFDESNPDINYSLKGTETQREIAELREQVDRLRTNVERWKNETKRSDRQAVDPKVVERTARALAKEYTGSAKGADIARELESLYNFISHGGDGKDELTFESAFDRALAIADTLVENAVTQDDEAYREYEALRRYCRETPFVLGPEDAANITDYSSWAKGNRGRLRVKRGDRTNVDSYYQEMAQEWPEFFDPDITDPADQIQRIRSVLDGLYTINEYNPFSEHMEDAKLYAANDIMDRFWDVPNVKKTFADRAEERLIRETSKWRERAEQNVQTERQKREEAVQRLKDHYKEVKARASERKADSQARTRLLKIAKRLQNKKLPAAGRALLDQYIGDLDTVSKSITGKTLDNLRELEDWYRAKTNPDSAEYDPDFIPDDATLKKLERLHQRRIADMTADEVADLTDILLNIENELRTSKQLIDQEDRRNVYHMGEEVIKDIYSTKGNDPGVRGAAGRFIATQTLSPVRLMHKLTGYNDADPMYKLTQALNDGQRAAIDYERRAKIPFRELAADKAFNKMFSGKDAGTIQVTGLTKDGARTVTITPAMRVSLYLHSLNNQNLRHIRDGGITVPDAKLYAKGNIQEAYNRGVTIKLEPSQVRAITSRMTPKEREFARLVHNYFNGMSRTEINEVSEKLKGYSLAQVEDYYPIKTDRSFGKGEFESMKFDGTIEGMGWTKERQAGAANPIMLMDVNRVLDQSISQHAKYVGLAIPVRNFNKVWGVTTASYDAQGNRSSYESSVQQALKQRWGGTNYDAVEKMMTDLQNPRSGADNPWSKALSKLQSNYAGAVLTLNGSVAIKQTASYPTAAAVLGWEPLAKAMKDFGKVNLDLIEKYTPLQWYRSQGFSTRELGDMAKNPNAMNRLLSKPALNWVQGMDVLTTRKLWKASEYYVQANNKDVRRGTDEYYKAVADIYNRVIEETQPNYTTMQRPNMLRSDNDLLRAISMFKTQPFQNFNVIYDAAGNLRAKLRQGDEAAIKQAKKEFGWAVTSQAAQLAVFAGMTMLWQLFRGKKDKYDDDDGEVSLTSMLTGLSKDMIAGAASIVPFGGEAWEMIASKVFGEKYYGLDVSAVETVNDAVAGLQSADKLISDMAQKIVDGEPVDAAGTWIKLKKVLGNVSKIAGAPVDNVLKLSSAIYRRGAIAAYGRYLGEYKALTVTSDPNTSTNRGAYYDLLYKASQTDQKQYVEMYKEMLESGAFTADQIKSGMEDRMKKTEGVNSVKDLSHRFVAPK